MSKPTFTKEQLAEMAGKGNPFSPNGYRATISDLAAFALTLMEGKEAAEAERDGLTKECVEVEQRLGKALGYPWYKDDPKNFPGSTEADGVCVGEHLPGTIAAEAANRIEWSNAEIQRYSDLWVSALCTPRAISEAVAENGHELAIIAAVRKSVAERDEARRELAELVEVIEAWDGNVPASAWEELPAVLRARERAKQKDEEPK